MLAGMTMGEESVFAFRKGDNWMKMQLKVSGDATKDGMKGDVD